MAAPFLSLLSLATLGSTLVVSPDGIDYHHLPQEPVFPGPWDRFIKAPANKSYITPARIWMVDGNVTTTSNGGYLSANGDILIGEGGHITLEFEENISGRVCFQVDSVTDEPVLMLAYTESSFFVGERTDATNDDPWDLPLDLHPGKKTGKMCVGDDFLRGGFKYLTLYIDDIPVFESPTARRLRYLITTVAGVVQKVLGKDPISNIVGQAEKDHIPNPLLVYPKFGSTPNGRAYSGYFYSSNDLLNRIWYAGAYTLQLSTIDPKEGSALIHVNSFLTHHDSPPGSWYSNFTVSQGTAVTTDGAKRDRLVWPGDMYIAIPGIAVSTYDMLAVRNALDVVFWRQYSDGRLPYAGPPLSYHNEFSDTYHMHTLLGVYDYVMYSGDIDWLRKKWPDYMRAFYVSVSKVDSKNLMHVTSPFDWNRHGMGGHNVEASAMLQVVLKRTIELSSFLESDPLVELPDVDYLESLVERLDSGIEALYCNHTGLYSDNLQDRHCFGDDHCDPQDGNSWALIAGMVKTIPTQPYSVSEALRARWNKFGAPAIEFPNVMSPFSSSFELQAHCAAGNHDAAVELMLLMWGYLLEGPGFTNSTLAEGFRTDGYVHYPAYPIPSRNSHAHGWAAGAHEHPHHEHPRHPARGARGRGVARPARPVVFEVLISRVLYHRGGRLVGHGEVFVVRAPEGTRGQVGWGDEEDDCSWHVAMTGGPEPRAWVRIHHLDTATTSSSASPSSDSSTTTGTTYDEVDLHDAAASLWLQKAESDDERWFDQELFYHDGLLVYDQTFEVPVMQERASGVVDEEAMETGYAKPIPWMWDNDTYVEGEQVDL
ncbi:alpha-L-rhamnosidase A [Apiospora saccharicola]